MKVVKYQSEISNHVKNYITDAGNGKAVPQTILDKNGVAVKQLDAEGNQVVHSLYDEIQLNAKTNDYRKVLESGGDIKLFAGTSDEKIDVSEFGEASDLLDVQAKLKANGINLSDLSKIVADLMSKQANGANVSQNASNDVKTDEIKDEKKENK